MSAPMPLDAALQHCFPFGGISKSTMLTAIRQGKLRCKKYGRTYMVTEADIEEWGKSCLVEKKRDFGSGSERAENPNGSFSTTDANTKQAIAEAMAQRLRSGLIPSTSLASTERTQAKVIRPKFRSRKS